MYEVSVNLGFLIINVSTANSIFMVPQAVYSPKIMHNFNLDTAS